MRISLRSWRLVRVGLWLKFVAVLLVVGGVGLAVAGVAATRNFAEPFELLLAVVGVALAVDGAGRLCCLALPTPGAARRWVRLSVALQLTGAAALAGTVALWNLDLLPEEPVFAVGVAAPLLQLGAAITFVMFLGELAKLLDRPDVARRATRVLGWVVMTWTVGGALGVAVVAAVAVAWFFALATLMMGGIGGFVAAFVLGLVLLPFVAAELAMIGTMYVGYGRVLYQLGSVRTVNT